MEYMTFFFPPKYLSFRKTEDTEDLACQFASDYHWSPFWDAAFKLPSNPSWDTAG